MVIHEDFEAPMEIPVIKKPAPVIPNKYVIAKNHIREVSISDDNNKHVSEIENQTINVEKKRQKQLRVSQMSSQEPTCYNVEHSHEVNSSDLQELVIVYRKCKRILKRIESKYGHLLNLDDNETQHTSTESENDTKKRKRKLKISCNENVEIETQCTCHAKKKIVFDDNGEQLQLSPSKSNHICFKKLKRFHDGNLKIVDSEKIENLNNVETAGGLQVELEESDVLPEDIVSLSKLLQNDEISMSYRKKIIDKIKMFTQEQSFELHVNKQSLIRQLREGSEDVIEFKGSNLYLLPGYLEP